MLKSVNGKPRTVRCTRTGAVIQQSDDTGTANMTAMCKHYLFRTGSAHGDADVARLQNFVVEMLGHYRQIPESESKLGIFLAREFPEEYQAQKRLRGPVPVAIELLKRTKESKP